MRFLLFVAAFVIAVLLTAPLDRWLLNAASGPLASVGAELRVASLHFALPLGIRATGVGLETAQASLDFHSLYVGITRAFHADACGGHLHGRLGSESISIDLVGVDPSRCLHVGKIALETTLEGSLRLDGIDLWNSSLGVSPSARIDLMSPGGVFGGILAKAGQDGADLPLGEWEFSDLVLHATFAGGELTVKEGHAVTSGVEWQLLGAKLPSTDSHSALHVDFRARQVEDGPRSRALLGFMPKAAADAGGWHNYRVTGSLAAPRVVGIN